MARRRPPQPPEPAAEPSMPFTERLGIRTDVKTIVWIAVLIASACGAYFKILYDNRQMSERLDAVLSSQKSSAAEYTQTQKENAAKLRDLERWQIQVLATLQARGVLPESQR